VNELTKKQETILRYIQEFIADNGYPPTIREMAERFQVHIKAVQDHISALKAKGVLTHQANKARGFELATRVREIPIYGRVAAGHPIFAVENIEGYVNDSHDRKRNVFALRVTGDSMIDAGIVEGDIVLVRKQSTAEDKDIVIAMVGEEATVKRFRKKSGRLFLEPANVNYAVIREPFEIIGKVIELRRAF
jgi:repressor LexA